jgi:tartrate dehydrogenase/decarboxylase/D-malate dehydrogenase
MNNFTIATIPGDGIGKDIIKSAIELVDLSSEIVTGFKCEWEMIEAGAEYYSKNGKDVEPKGEKKIDKADGIFLALSDYLQLDMMTALKYALI